jgi:hypothetical protein
MFGLVVLIKRESQVAVRSLASLDRRRVALSGSANRCRCWSCRCSGVHYEAVIRKGYQSLREGDLRGRGFRK